MRVRLSKSKLLIALFSASFFAAPSQGQSGNGADLTGGISIPYREFTLPNGLRVVVQTDHRTPVVAVNIWYHIGSKNERAGRTGFAHLFEHLMYQGSENYRDEFFRPFDLIGVTNRNGTTYFDRTNYFETVPTNALDMTLWMESDRMGHLLGAIDQATLNEQRGVVENEKRQNENNPYGMTIMADLYRTLFPKGHPYHTLPIGSMADLNAATLDDVKAWFKSWYGPNNAVLVLAGDIDLTTAREKAMRYFGDIPATATVSKIPVNIPELSRDSRLIIPDRVPHVRIYRSWPVVQDQTPDAVLLQMFANILATGSSSRLGRRLVLNDQLADSVSAGYEGLEIAGVFSISANLKKDADPARVEKIIEDELQRLMNEGPTPDEVERTRTSSLVGLAASTERTSSRAMILNTCATYTGRPDCWKDEVRALQEATSASIQTAARKWLSRHSSTVLVTPGEVSAGGRPEVAEVAAPRRPVAIPARDPRFTTVKSDVDRSLGVPKVAGFIDFKMPVQQHTKLSNGMPVTLVNRPGSPLVQLSMIFDGGTADDTGKSGRGVLANTMFKMGAGKYDTAAFAARQQALGGAVRMGVGLTSSNASLTALKQKLPDMLDLLADMVRRPTFAPSELDRTRGALIATLEQLKATPMLLGPLVFSEKAYGKDHPFFSLPSADEINAVTRDDLIAWHRDWIRPDTARIVVVGDMTLSELMPILEAKFGDWRAATPPPARRTIPTVALPDRPTIYLIDKPGATSSVIVTGQLVPPAIDPNRIDFSAANSVLGAGLTSRLTMNLREDKHWSYGATSVFSERKDGQGSWRANSAVQTDKTAEAMLEMRKEIVGLATGSVPTTPAEVDKFRATIYTMPSMFETGGPLLRSIVDNQEWGRPDNYLVDTAIPRYKAMTPELVDAAARKTLLPNRMFWVVVGDLSKIEAPIRRLGLGEVTVVDADGSPIRK